MTDESLPGSAPGPDAGASPAGAPDAPASLLPPPPPAPPTPPAYTRLPAPPSPAPTASPAHQPTRPLVMPVAPPSAAAGPPPDGAPLAARTVPPSFGSAPPSASPFGTAPPSASPFGTAPPPAAAPFGTAPAAVDPRRRARVLLVLAALLAAVGLVSGGIAIGSHLGDSSGTTTAAGVANGGSGVPVSTERQGGPSVSGGTTTDEPAADAAKIVQPSVVLIRTSDGLGSGIVYDASGNIVTNAHVVGTATSVQVQFNTGANLSGNVVGKDTRRDIAVVKVTPKDAITPATFAKTADVRVGQMAVAVGSPFGLDQTVTAGIVSAVDRIIASGRTADSTAVPMIQTDAPINPGNSGGALADRQGRVIGMNTSIRTDGTSTGNVGVGFAVPADTIINVVDRILKGDSLAVAYLGVSTKDGDGVPGAVVTSVTAGSPAEKAGLKAGDRITAIDSQQIRTKDDLRARVQLHTPGESSALSVVRSDGSAGTVTVTFGQG